MWMQVMVKVIFKNCAPFINCISEINNTQVDNAIEVIIQNHMEVCGNTVEIYCK